ncbi:MAG TPA: hypothetical protein VM661_18220 [Candidatus Sulfotelmatobacter sp.]|jgi:hypothetical protein|nr:hypothetical protein [Candidatus Sulfotelmatobacter sp.]
MGIGRVVGWAFLVLAMLMASGDAVLAFAPGEHARLMTADIWLLVSGRVPRFEDLPSLTALLLALPAWLVAAPVGGVLLWACRPRRRRYFSKGR